MKCCHETHDADWEKDLAAAGLRSKQPGMERDDQVLIQDFYIGASH